MSNKINKKNNKVVREMKECFQSFQLPVYKNKNHKDIDLAFTSQICNDHVCATVFATYDRQVGYVGIDFSFHPPMPLERVTEIIKLLNLLNGVRVLRDFSICSCCNMLKLKTGLFIQGETLPMSKYKRLIENMLEDSYHTFPLIMEVVNGENFRTACDRFMDDHKDLWNGKNTYTETIKEEILNDAKTVLAHCHFNLDDKSRVNDAYTQGYQYPKVPGLDFVLGIKVSGENEALVLSISAAFNVPDDRKDIVMELVNLINKVCRGTHMYYSHDKKNVVLLSGVMLKSGLVDKAELKSVFTTFVSYGFGMLPIVYEQMTSAESPKTLILKVYDSNSNANACI
jgi:hypothetical protein